MSNYLIICARYNENVRWILPFIKNSVIFNKGLNNLHYIASHKIVKKKNFGREGGTYLDFIIKNYDKLPDFMFFIQGNPFDHIFHGNIDRSLKEIVNIIKNKKRFQYLSQNKIYLKDNEYKEFTSGIPALHNDLLNIDCKLNLIFEYIDNFNCTNQNLNELKSKLLNWDKDSIKIHNFHSIISKMSYFISNEEGQKIRDTIYLLFNDSVLDKMIQYKYYFGYGALFWVHKSRILKFNKNFWINLSKGFDTIKPGAGWGLEKMWNLILNDYYQRSKWVYNYPLLNLSVVDYLRKIVNLDENINLLFLTSNYNEKFYYYKKVFKNTKLFSKAKYGSKIKNHYELFFRDSVRKFIKKTKSQEIVLYINNLTNEQLKNVFNLCTELCTKFYFIIDNIIEKDNFYLDNTPLELFFNMRNDLKFTILGRYHRLILGIFPK